MNGSMEKNVSRDTPLKAPRLNLVIVRSEVAYVYGCMNLGFWDSHSASFWVGWLSVCVCVCFFCFICGKSGGGGGGGGEMLSWHPTSFLPLALAAA